MMLACGQVWLEGRRRPWEGVVISCFIFRRGGCLSTAAFDTEVYHPQHMLYGRFAAHAAHAAHALARAADEFCPPVLYLLASTMK